MHWLEPVAVQYQYTRELAIVNIDVLPTEALTRLEPTGACTRPKSHDRVLAGLLAGYLLCLPVQFATEAGFRIAPSDGFLILYYIFGVTRLKFVRPRVWTGWHAAVLFAFALSTLTAVLKGEDLDQYVILNKDLGVLVLFAAYAMLTGEATSWQKIRGMLRLFVLGVSFMNVVALISYFNLSPWLAETVFRMEYTKRLSGLLIDPNAYGGLLAVTFAIHTITYYSAKPLVGGPTGLLISILLLVGVLYTFSRSSWISVTCTILVLSAVRPKVAASMLLTIGIVLSTIIALADRSSLENIMHMSARPEQVEGRIDIINSAMPRFLANPIFGIGLGSFGKSYGIIIHNTPVWFLTEFGLIGFISVAGFFVSFLIRGLRTYKLVQAEEKPLVLGLIVADIAVLGLSMGIEAFYQRHWWLTIALISAASLQCPSNMNETERLWEMRLGRNSSVN
ncbi:MAG: O-antigen ligase family protein [Bryobacteraceae bacterium]